MDASMASNQYFVVAFLIRMWNVDQSYMTIIILIINIDYYIIIY